MDFFFRTVELGKKAPIPLSLNRKNIEILLKAQELITYTLRGRNATHQHEYNKCQGIWPTW